MWDNESFIESLASHLEAQWRTVLLPDAGACASLESFQGIGGGRWCRGDRWKLMTSEGAMLVEPEDEASPLLLKVKGVHSVDEKCAGRRCGGTNLTHHRAEHSGEHALVHESRALRGLRMDANSSMRSRVLWTSSPFPVGSSLGPLAVLQQRIRPAIYLCGRHRRLSYEPLLKASAGCFSREPCTRMRPAQHATVARREGRMLLGRVASELLLWSDYLWRKQLHLPDLQFLIPPPSPLSTPGADVGRLHLFDPRLAFVDEKGALFKKAFRGAHGPTTRLEADLHIQRLDLLSLALHAALLALGRADVVTNEREPDANLSCQIASPSRCTTCAVCARSAVPPLRARMPRPPKWPAHVPALWRHAQDTRCARGGLGCVWLRQRRKASRRRSQCPTT
jgi:hypothetical protein